MHRNNKQAMIISWILNSYLNVCFPLLYFAEVSAVFETGTSVTYTFQEPYPVTKNLSQSSSAIYAESAPSKENIALSFVTAQAPSLLLYINSSSHDFLAVLLCKNGEYWWQGAWWSVILGSGKEYVLQNSAKFQPKFGVTWAAYFQTCRQTLDRIWSLWVAIDMPGQCQFITEAKCIYFNLPWLCSGISLLFILCCSLLSVKKGDHKHIWISEGHLSHISCHLYCNLLY